MVIGLLSDAHGNPLGLRSSLAALRVAGAGTIYFLGDAVGYLPGETEVIEVLVSEGVICQRGNHEGMLLGDLPLDADRDRSYMLAAVRERMPSHLRAVLAGRPDVREIKVAGPAAIGARFAPRPPERICLSRQRR